MPLKPGEQNIGSNISHMLRKYKRTGRIGTTRPRSMRHAQKIAAAAAYNKANESEFTDPIDRAVDELLETDTGGYPRSYFKHP